MPDSDATTTVTVSLRSILAKFRPNPKDRAPFPVRLRPGATVADLLQALRVSDKLAKLVFVDHVRSDPTAPLRDGATVDIFPPVAGG